LKIGQYLMKLCLKYYWFVFFPDTVYIISSWCKTTATIQGATEKQATKFHNFITLSNIILCVECFHCYVIINCYLISISCTLQLMVALINHLLIYLLKSSFTDALSSIFACPLNKSDLSSTDFVFNRINNEIIQDK